MLDQGKVALALALLDLSAALDTVNHRILLCRLHESYGIGGMTLTWIIRTVYTLHTVSSTFVIATFCTPKLMNDVHCDPAQSTSQFISFGVPLGWVIGQLLFVLYIADLALIADRRLHPHLYADDTRIESTYATTFLPRTY